MKRMILAAGVAALAITAPAAAKPGGDHGNGGRAHASAKSGGGKAHVEARGGGKVQARNGAIKARARMAARSDMRANRAGKANVRVARAQRTQQVLKQRKLAYVHARQADARRMAVRAQVLNRRDGALRTANMRNAKLERIAERRREAIRDVNWGRGWNERDVGRAWAYGCPPGLAKKPVACMPPGLAKKMIGARMAQVRQQVAFRDVPLRLRNAYRDTPDYYYRYGDGYMYRVNRSNDVVSALLPLFGLGYTVGQPFPASYPNYAMPTALQSFYPDTPYSSYRYGNGYVYQVDPASGMIEGVNPMLGYGYGYGQMLPMNYSAYNVPYQYRPYYADTSDAYYRYAPGAIYQVDPKTSLITGVAALLSGGMTVGQPMPLGYSAYNVPYAYRSNYYDTPDAMYRYANGNIYQVDPTTQLVTALVAAALT